MSIYQTIIVFFGTIVLLGVAIGGAVRDIARDYQRLEK